MMQNARGRKSQSVRPHAYPATIGRGLTKQFECQSLRCGTEPLGKSPDGALSFSLRHSSAAGMRFEQPIDVPRYRWRPILRQFPPGAHRPIKALAGFRGIPQMRRPASATFSSAQALATCSLPHRKQNRKCLENDHSVTFFHHLASERGTADIAGPSNHTRTSRAHHGGSRLRSEERTR
jgi:hypothetical protein